MIYLHHPTQFNSIDPDLQSLLNLRYQQLGSLEGMILVEAEDSMSDLETAMGFSFLLWDDDPDSLACELIEDHGHCYEMVFLFSDGAGETVLFIPKQARIDADLLNLCQIHAISSN
jgi:hypothetical protein